MNYANKNNLITETYHSLGPWSNEKLVKKLSENLKKNSLKASDLVKMLDNQIIDKSLFSFKDVVNQTPEIELRPEKRAFKVIYTYELEGEKFQDFFYGNDELGGIAYNSSFDSLLTDAKISKVSKSKKTNNLNENVCLFQKIYNQIIFESATSVELKLIFSFNAFKYVGDDKSESSINEKNPNYVKEISGTVSLGFNENPPIKIGTLTYKPKRTADMNPKPSLLDGMKELWNNNSKAENLGKPTTDFGIAGLVAKNAMKRIGTSLFGKTLQKESFEITIDDQYDKDHIIKSGDLETDLSAEISNYFNNEIKNGYVFAVTCTNVKAQLYKIVVTQEKKKLEGSIEIYIINSQD